MIGRVGVRNRAPYLYILGGLAAVAGFYFVSVPGLPSWAPRLVLDGCIVLSAAIAILVGVRRNRPGYRTPWFLIAAYQFVYVAADLLFYAYHYVREDTRFPAPADVFYVSKYAFLVVGLLLIARRRSVGGDRTSLLDALVLASAGSLLCWEFLMRPYFDGDMGLLVRATSLAVPAMDIGVLVVALRLFVGSGRRVPAFYLLNGSILFLLFSDTVYGSMQLAGTDTTGNFLDATWFVSALLLGAAALHPSMARVAERAEVRQKATPLIRVMPLAGAALVGPLTLAVSTFAHYEVDELAFAAVGAVVFSLVILRLFDLMRVQGRVNETLARREEDLQQVVAALQKTELERARLFEEAVRAAEEERMRVASELHDGPIQQLTALALTLDLTTLHLDRGDDAALRIALGKARGHAADQMLALRRLMIELRPPALDEIGLEAALRDYMTDFDRRIEARCEFLGELGERRLGSSVETTLYRIAQEALTNVCKHAHASSVRVVLSSDSDAVRLRVEDDGVGFEEEQSSELIKDGRFGLIGMRERVERAGGALNLHDAPGGGTVIDVLLPLAAAPTSALPNHLPIKVRAA
jgi:signal transduction histidine kinase